MVGVDNKLMMSGFSIHFGGRGIGNEAMLSSCWTLHHGGYMQVLSDSTPIGAHSRMTRMDQCMNLDNLGCKSDSEDFEGDITLAVWSGCVGGARDMLEGWVPVVGRMKKRCNENGVTVGDIGSELEVKE